MNRLSRSVEPPRVLNIEDLRRRAKRRLPRVVFDYIDGGAEDESTLRTNCRAFESVTLRPRCAVATPVAGFRERDLRNGAKELLSGKVASMLPFVNQLLVRPRWLVALLADGGLMKFENVVIPGKGPMLYADVTAALEQSVVTWDDLTWIRQAWNGPVVIKGIHTGDDARRAVDAGANALVVSNHGGRQLDDVAPTLRVLPEVVAAVGDRIEVLLDGGIRRGSDIVKALC